MHTEYSLSELLHQPQQTQTAQLLAIRIRDADEHTALEHYITQHTERLIYARPSVPWEPLAPLRQLVESCGVPYPDWTPEDACISSALLGVSPVQTRLFLRMATALRTFNVWFWIRAEDLQLPVWGDFLRWVQRGQWKAPIGFVYTLSPTHRALPGTSIYTGTEYVEHFEGSSSSTGPASISFSKNEAKYLTQLLLLGDTLRLDEMKKVSRANHARHIRVLRQKNVLQKDNTLVPEALFNLRITALPKGSAWCRSVFKRLQSRQTEPSQRSLLWLKAHRSTVLQGTDPKTSTYTHFAFIFEQSSQLHNAQTLGRAFSSESIWRSIVNLLQGRQKDALEPIDINSSTDPNKDSIQHLERLLTTALTPQEVGALQAESLHIPHGTSCTEFHVQLALLYARWHLSQGRIQSVFTLLKAHQTRTEWALQWQLHRIYSEAFRRMKRLDLARSHLEKAIAFLPQPISPVLLAEVRIASTQIQLAQSSSVDAAEQLEYAKKTFIAAGDGKRLGSLLSIQGEEHWKHRRWDEARAMFTRALELFRQNEAFLELAEVRLKLGLVLRKSPANTLHI